MIRRTSVTTLDEALQMFTAEKRAKNLTKRTIEGYEAQIKQFLKDSDISLNDSVTVLNKHIILSYVNFLLAKDISHESVNAYLRPIRVFMNWLYDNEYVNEKIKVEMVKGQEQKIKFYNEEELELLCKKPAKDCSFTEHRTFVIVCFCLATGARVGTLIDIKREDLNLNEHYVIYTHLKNKSSQMIPLSPSIVDILRDYLKTWDIGDYIFCDNYGNKATVAAIRSALNNYCTKRGVKPRGIHALRHSFAREWIKNNGNSYQLQRMLTHKSTEMVKKYVNLYAEDIQIEEYAPIEYFVKNNKKIKRN